MFRQTCHNVCVSPARLLNIKFLARFQIYFPLPLSSNFTIWTSTFGGDPPSPLPQEQLLVQLITKVLVMTIDLPLAEWQLEFMCLQCDLFKRCEHCLRIEFNVNVKFWRTISSPPFLCRQLNLSYHKYVQSYKTWESSTNEFFWLKMLFVQIKVVHPIQLCDWKWPLRCICKCTSHSEETFSGIFNSFPNSMHLLIGKIFIEGLSNVLEGWHNIHKWQKHNCWHKY